MSVGNGRHTIATAHPGPKHLSYLLVWNVCIIVWGRAQKYAARAFVKGVCVCVYEESCAYNDIQHE